MYRVRNVPVSACAICRLHTTITFWPLRGKLRDGGTFGAHGQYLVYTSMSFLYILYVCIYTITSNTCIYDYIASEVFILTGKGETTCYGVPELPSYWKHKPPNAHVHGRHVHRLSHQSKLITGPCMAGTLRLITEVTGSNPALNGFVSCHDDCQQSFSGWVRYNVNVKSVKAQ